MGPRQPCPCGSGRRYKSCHGSAAGAPAAYVARPFAGLAGETDLVALREFVPAATAPVRVRGHEDRDVTLCSLLPGAVPAMVRQDGSIALGLQVQHQYGDPSRDLAAALLAALDGEPGQVIGLGADPGEGPRLQDLLPSAGEEPLTVTVHEGFDYWLTGLDSMGSDGSMAAALSQANDAIAETRKLASVPSAYWTDVTAKEYLRFAMPYDEDPLLDALAVLHVEGVDRLVEGGRMVGMFRAQGLLVPVWDLESGTGAEALEAPAREFLDRLETVLEDRLRTSDPLTPEQRSARAGLANRQVTLR